MLHATIQHQAPICKMFMSQAKNCVRTPDNADRSVSTDYENDKFALLWGEAQQCLSYVMWQPTLM